MANILIQLVDWIKLFCGEYNNTLLIEIMNRKLRIYSVSIVLTAMALTSCSSIKSMDRVSAKDRIDLAKQYAMGSILYFALKTEGFELTDKDVSLSICVEVGNLSVDFTTAIDKMAESAAKSIKPTEIDDYDLKKPIVMDCVSFMNSKPVADTIKKYLKMR